MNEEDLLYHAIGRFAVAFEILIDKIRQCIVHGLLKNGLTEPDLAQLLVANQTAASLRKLLGAMFANLYPKDEDGRRKVLRLLKRIEKLTSERNLVLHGTWDIGDPFWTDDYGIAEGRNVKASEKEGIKTEWMEFSPNDFHELTDEAEALAELVTTLLVCAFMGDSTETVRWSSSFDP